jgi:hypothetical protein
MPALPTSPAMLRQRARCRGALPLSRSRRPSAPDSSCITSVDRGRRRAIRPILEGLLPVGLSLARTTPGNVRGKLSASRHESGATVAQKHIIPTTREMFAKKTLQQAFFANIFRVVGIACGSCAACFDSHASGCSFRECEGTPTASDCLLNRAVGLCDNARRDSVAVPQPSTARWPRPRHSARMRPAQ